MICEDDPEVVIIATKILAKLLVVHGSSYVRKFADMSGGFVIMRHRLKRWWHVRALWPICFGILFGQDVGPVDIDRPFEGDSFLDLFAPVDTIKIEIPEMIPVIIGIFQSGLRSVLSNLPPEGDPVLTFDNTKKLPKSESSSSGESRSSLRVIFFYHRSFHFPSTCYRSWTELTGSCSLGC